MNLFVIAVLVLIFIFLGSAVIGLLKGAKLAQIECLRR